MFEDKNLEVEKLIGQYAVKNNECKNQAEESSKTKNSCDERNNLFKLIESKGWCYGKEGEAEFEKKWHQCKKEVTQDLTEQKNITKIDAQLTKICPSAEYNTREAFSQKEKYDAELLKVRNAIEGRYVKKWTCRVADGNLYDDWEAWRGHINCLGNEDHRKHGNMHDDIIYNIEFNKESSLRFHKKIYNGDIIEFSARIYFFEKNGCVLPSYRVVLKDAELHYTKPFK